MHVQGLAPILNVSNIEQSIIWFEKFGWKRLWDWHPPYAGAPVTFGAVGSGEVEIFLCLDGQGGRGTGGGHGSDGQGVWMSLFVENVDAEYSNCVAAGLDVIRAPKDEPWRVREMHVRHPDGHTFRVGHGLPCDEVA